MNRILVIEDEEIIRKQIVLLLERNNYEVSDVGNIEDALQCDPETFDVILADIRLPGESGTEIIKHSGQVPVIVMTSFASVRSAVDSMKLGAVNYVSKPFDHDELLLVIARSLHENRLSAQNAAMKKDLERVFPQGEILIESPSMKHMVERLAGLNNEDYFIYISGERGAGRELLARMCHSVGSRQAGPLVFADLPADQVDEIDSMLFGSQQVEHGLPAQQPRQGLFQAAHSGTLVLRDVLLTPLATQRKIIEYTSSVKMHARPYDVRIVALGSDSLEIGVSSGQLDAEFAGLFSPYVFAVLPLRDRRDDIPALANQYLELFVKRYRKRKISLSAEAFHALQAYEWPGNITELKSVVERAVLMVDTEEIKPAHLGIGVMDGIARQTPFDVSLDAYFRYFVLNFQEQLSETELASKLGISRKALWERRQRMDLPRKTGG